MNRAKVAYLAWMNVTALVIIIFSAICILGTHRTQLAKHVGAFEDGLIPANDPDPTTECDLRYPLPKNAIKLYLGTNRFNAVAAFFPWAVLVTQDGIPVLTFERDATGIIGLDLDVRDSNHRIIARLERNRFIVNANNILIKRQPDRSTLIILDQQGNEVVNFRYINERTLRFTGRFYVDGIQEPVVINEKGVDMGERFIWGLCEPYHEKSAVKLFLPRNIARPE